MKLNELCKKGKSTLRQKDLLNDGPYPVYGAPGIVGTMKTFQNEMPYICVVKDGAGVGRVMSCEACSSVLGTMQALIPEKGVNKDYLLHLIRSLKLGEGFSGSTIPHIYFKDYGKRVVPDYSFVQQAEIASVFNLIESLIEQRKTILEKLEQLIKSRFVEMFSNCPKNVYLGDVCKFQSGKTVPKEKELSQGDCLYAKVGDLTLPGNEVEIRVSRSYLDAETARKNLIPKGAVVFPKRGGAIGTNKKRITSEPCCLDLNLMSVIPGEQICTSYLFAWFGQMDLADISNGSTVPQINNKDLNGLIIPLPGMLQQQQFADFVAQVDKSRFV